MATSAFRSTTRRNCQIGGSGSAETHDVPSTPRARRDPSPSGRGLHRRSSSMTDFSARYFSDCSSTSDFRSSYTKGSRTGRSSVCPSDSESDMDSLYAHRRSRKWGAESEDERPTNPPMSTISATKSERKGLRRTLSSQDFSQNISKTRLHVSVLDRKPEGNDTEDLAEEKTIRAVYAQMKSLSSDPPVGDVGMNDFLDAMRTEVRRAVSDIRMELEESMQKNGKLSSTVDVQDRSESQGTDVIQAVADIRKEYTMKLEESEKRVRELWSQIAVEERRCLELSKIVKELLPTPPPVTTSTANNSSSRRRPLRRKNSAERQLDLKSLDEEALRYFEECVSISSYDCQGDSDDSLREKENNGRRRNGREIAAKSPSTVNGCKGETQPKASSIGSDGVVLPWLQWEAEGGGSGDKNSKQISQVERGGVSGKSKTQFQRSSNISFSAAKKLPAKTSAAEQMSPSTWSASGACETKLDVLESRQKPRASSSSSLFSVEDCNVVQSDGSVLDVDTLLLEKIKFRCRVENGELLLCQGLFLM